ncbi:hypothetical protein E1263_10965 [Kribbella antibiotica]|uniref:Uncharacterized protein n=1 Tax=Kribbella antibiotica TaxID=190195 RepID=A0A4R4ZTS9_9ACTN|nr:hypothetical protein [Kribbella antibiotica]TDD60442.1 hypothetical protein E1263_10965 [Kribbella antibiotica]
MRGRALVLAVGVVASGLMGVQAATAQAKPEALPACQFGIPAKVAITKPNARLPIGMGATCPKAVYEAVWVGQADGVTGTSYQVACGWGHPNCGVVLENTYPGRVMHWTAPSGHGADRTGAWIASLRSATSTTKYGAAVSLTGARSGTKTTLTARPTYYSAKTKGFVRHHGRVLFQSKDPGSSVWKDLGYVVPSSTGAATYTLTTNRSRAYRAYVASSATVWYAYSANVTR